MKKQSRELTIIISEPKGGYDPNRLEMALDMLISEKDVIDYFTHRSRDDESKTRVRGSDGKAGEPLPRE